MHVCILSKAKLRNEKGTTGGAAKQLQPNKNLLQQQITITMEMSIATHVR